MEMTLDMSRTIAIALMDSVIFILRERRNSRHQFLSLTNISANIVIFSLGMAIS